MSEEFENRLEVSKQHISFFHVKIKELEEKLLFHDQRLTTLEESYSGQFIEISHIEKKVKELERFQEITHQQYQYNIKHNEKITNERISQIMNNHNNKRPEFTREQEDWLCYAIGDWYLAWKDRIYNKDGTHNLGRAKEMLKALICDDKDFFSFTFPLMMMNLKEELK